MGLYTTRFDGPRYMRPGGPPARYASFRSLRSKSRTIQANAVGRGQSSPSSERCPTEPDTPLRSEIAMSRFILICSFAATLAASSTQSADAVESTKKSAWEQDRLACADVGIDPGSSIFDQCVADLR